MYPAVTLKKERIKNVLQGHPWVFSGAIQRLPKIKTGDLCEVYGDGLFLGVGYFNANTDIAIRLISRRKEAIDAGFFKQKLADLKAQKERFVHNTNAYRAVFGESDGMPGLVVDKYAGTLVVQWHTVGMEKLKPAIVPALVAVFRPESIYETYSAHSWKIEGEKPKQERFIFGEEKKETVIKENGHSFWVNVAEGQKTGFFLDQRENRQSIAPFCRGRKVLNCFSYTGGFSVYAAGAGAAVTSVDISEEAIRYARKNFELNGFDLENHEFIAGDAFDYLNDLEENKFDVIVLDPPSFARKKIQIPAAIRAYTMLNSKALEKLKDDGILISASCTAHMDELTFIKILHQSAVNAGCALKVIHVAMQPFDHAYNLHFPEGRYLKFFILLKTPM